MRIFVGTLYTMENEFEECVASIQMQSYSNFQHFIFKNLPNKEAHDTLYRTFMERSDVFDLMIKVDADMVIEDDNLFAKIVQKLSANKWLDQLTIAVHDFFSDQLIWGMHAFRNSVKWLESDEDLFTDPSPVLEHKKLFDDKQLAPAAIHCKNPSPFQSFHYGIHKGLKILQPNRLTKNKFQAIYHWKNIEKTWQNFQENHDRRLGLAVLGAELVFSDFFQIKNLDYGDSLAYRVFDRYRNYNERKIMREIKHRRFLNYGLLPSIIRRDILFYLKDRYIFNKYTFISFLQKCFSIYFKKLS